MSTWTNIENLRTRPHIPHSPPILLTGEESGARIFIFSSLTHVLYEAIYNSLSLSPNLQLSNPFNNGREDSSCGLLAITPGKKPLKIPEKPIKQRY